MCTVNVDRGDDFAGTAETALADHIVGELAEKAPDQIEPSETRRREPFDIGRALRGRAQDLPLGENEGGEKRDGARVGGNYDFPAGLRAAIRACHSAALCGCPQA